MPIIGATALKPAAIVLPAWYRALPVLYRASAALVHHLDPLLEPIFLRHFLIHSLL